VKLSEVDWDELYARICAQTGWTWEYVGQYMTLPRLKALNKYWENNPPLHQQVQALFGGLGVDTTSTATPPEEGGFDDLIANFQAAGGRIG
jgi:hypothetical protein